LWNSAKQNVNVSMNFMDADMMDTNATTYGFEEENSFSNNNRPDYKSGEQVLGKTTYN
jgi:hypothetical protein